MYGLPDVVENVVGELGESQTFRDLRIMDNKYGTTLVMRFMKVDISTHLTAQDNRDPPLWRHRSPVNMTRDKQRHNEWQGTGQRFNSSKGKMGMEQNVNGGGLSLYTQGGVDKQTPVMDIIQSGLNANAEEFIMSDLTNSFESPKAPETCEMQHRSAQTDIEKDSGVAKEMIDSAMQCESSQASLCNVLVQCGGDEIQSVKSTGVQCPVQMHEVFSGTYSP